MTTSAAERWGKWDGIDLLVQLDRVDLDGS
jgi:hypothetical protein